MEFGLFEVLKLVGSLGFFIYGMKIMSEGIQNVAGDKMKQILAAMTSNKWAGVFTGFLITTIIQSSSATTVMLVSFVNASLLTLEQSIGVIMGANIGTTVTAWIISILGFKVKMSKLALPIIAFGLPMMFFSNKKTKQWGEVLVGFALLFMGLAALKDSVPTLSADQLVFLEQLTDYGILSTMLFVMIGTLITVVVQSSSAAMALTLVLCNQGIIPFEVAAAMVLGENIGTTITANLASLVGNTAAKRASRAHFIFNVFGVLWMIAVFPWFLRGIEYFMLNYTDYGSPFVNTGSVAIGLSIFHTSFNLINVMLMINLVKVIRNVVIKMVPEKEGEDDKFKLVYINTGELLTTEAALTQVKKEMVRLGEQITDMSGKAKKMLMLNEEQKPERKMLIEKIRKIEDDLDEVEVEVSDYLLKISESGSVSEIAALEIRSLMRISHDLERISDIYKSMSFVVEKRYGEKIWLTPEQQSELSEYFSLIDEVLELMNKNLAGEYGKADLDEAKKLEKRVNKKRKELRKVNMSRTTDKDDLVHLLAYNDLISSIERVGDHMLNVSEGVAGVVD
ncbi:Na/Pi cotransporter family protein [Limibacter armeniacum]|uniref:Na/Pi cotransporter family protein n=1 Tax=Limibacter armeniacum TaxID=466084 RepID=UPI002FE53750